MTLPEVQIITKKRRSYSPEFKFRIAPEALKGMETTAQMAQTHQVHSNQVRAWKKQLQEEGAQVFNSDQGSQFTASDFTARLEQAGIRISMDGRGRAFDNIFIERLWRTVKDEHVYLYRHETVPELLFGLTSYFRFYNHERFRQSLRYCTPAEVHFGDCPHAL